MRPLLLLLAAMAVLAPFSQTIYAPSMAAVRDDFGTSNTLVGLTVSIFALSHIVALGVYGPILDRTPARPVAMVALSLYTLACLLSYFAPNILLLILCRGLQALGIAAAGIIGPAIISDTTPPHRRASAIGFYQTLVHLGPVMGPLAGAAIAALFGWRADFLVLTAAGLFVLGCAARWLPRSAPGSDPITLHNIRTLVRHPTLWGAAFCALSQLFTLHSIISFLPVLLHERAGLTETAIGPALAVMTFAMVVAAPIGGALGDRLGPRNVVRWAATLAAAGAGGLAALVLLPPSPFPLPAVLLCLAAIGLGFGAAQAGQVTLIITWFPHLRGTALALYTMMRFTGGALGPLTLGTMADTAGLAPAFLAPFLVVSAAAAGAFLLIRDVPLPSSSGRGPG